MNLADLVRRMDNSNEDDESAPMPPAVMAEELRLRFSRMNEAHQFNPGDLVKIKDGLSGSYRKWMKYGIVVEVGGKYPHGTYADGDDICPTRRNDMIIASIDDCGDYCECVVDSRRFEPWEPPAL